MGEVERRERHLAVAEFLGLQNAEHDRELGGNVRVEFLEGEKMLQPKNVLGRISSWSGGVAYSSLQPYEAEENLQTEVRWRGQVAATTRQQQRLTKSGGILCKP